MHKNPYRKVWEVTAKSDAEEDSLSLTKFGHRPTLLYARWMTSPDPGTDSILFVENFNIFFIPDVGVENKKIYPISQTEAVVPEVVVHGIPDWIYEGKFVKRGHFTNTHTLETKGIEFLEWFRKQTIGYDSSYFFLQKTS